MNKILSVIGILAIIAGIGYFAIYCPVKTYQAQCDEIRKLKNEVSSLENKTDMIIQNYEDAMYYNVPNDYIKAVHSDTRFFEKLDKPTIKGYAK